MKAHIKRGSWSKEHLRILDNGPNESLPLDTEERLKKMVFLQELKEASYAKVTLTYEGWHWEGPTFLGRVVADQFRTALFEESLLGKPRKSFLSIGSYAFGILSGIALPILTDHLRQFYYL
jgi:hypothetical protein